MISRTICPWCRSDLSGDTPPVCPTCERNLFDDAGNALREIDLVFDRVENEERKRRTRFLLVGTPIAALASLVAPAGHGFFLPVLMLAHAVSQHLYLVREARQLLGGRRKFFARNIARGTFLIMSGVGYSITTIPILGVLAGAITFSGVTWITQVHLMWSLGQERERKPTEAWEKVVLALLVLAILGILVALTLFGYVGWLLIESVRDKWL